MSRIVFCKKLKMNAEGLSSQPFPGPLGEQIYNDISDKAWQLWTRHQTMLINEYRLSLMDPQARKFLAQEMQKFLFEGGSDTPPGYQAK